MKIKVSKEVITPMGFPLEVGVESSTERAQIGQNVRECFRIFQTIQKVRDCEQIMLHFEKRGERGICDFNMMEIGKIRGTVKNNETVWYIILELEFSRMFRYVLLRSRMLYYR